MAINIEWGTKTINVSQSDMVLIQTSPSIIYRLDLDLFRIALKGLEESSDGMAFERTHKHNTTVSVGGASLARVIEIVNGYTVKFEETGTPYRVNTVGANSNIGEKIDVGSGQVSVSTSNSAGLQDLNSLQAASFNGEVSVNISSSFTGTQFPVGTNGNPVNNIEDALLIAKKRGLFVFRIMENMDISVSDFSSGFNFVGSNVSAVKVTLLDNANFNFCTFMDMTIQGVLDNSNVVRDLFILDIFNVNGFIHRCALGGTITLGSAQLTILDCFSGIAGSSSTPIIDMNGGGYPLAIRGYSGGLKIINCSSGNHSLDFSSGNVIIDSSVTGGEITIRGVVTVIDNSTGTAIINQDSVLSRKGISKVVNAITPAQFIGLK